MFFRGYLSYIVKGSLVFNSDKQLGIRFEFAPWVHSEAKGFVNCKHLFEIFTFSPSGIKGQPIMQCIAFILSHNSQ